MALVDKTPPSRYITKRRLVRLAREFRLAVSPFAFLPFLLGCATGTVERGFVQFDPAPVAEVGAQELEPISLRTIEELLGDANNAFIAANRAQEDEDFEAAFRQYTLMLELLIEADLDPAIFYDLRNQFSAILDTTTQVAKNFNRELRTAPPIPRIEDALRLGLAVPDPLPQRVLNEIEEIRTVYPKNFQAGLNRSSKYLPYIRAEFQKAGFPEDLVWLAMVESQFTPKINSRAGAGGMWQFMRGTGRHYGLTIDYYVDERYNWKKSTQAAISYLRVLHEMFDEQWPLAISAYNMGERGLERAIAMNGGDKNLWSLIESPPAANRIRRETKKFYPKLLASTIVARNPEAYGFTVTPALPDDTDDFSVRGSYALKDIEKAIGVPANTLRRLNPQLVLGVTPPEGTIQISIPAGKRTQVARAMETLPKYRPGSHVVQRNETLGEIAQRYRVSLADLMAANNVRSPKRLQIGQKLLIPGLEGGPSATETPAGASADGTYRVRRGDSLSRIAARHRVSVAELQQWNGLGRRTTIRSGAVIFVARPEQKTASSPGVEAAKQAAFKTHTVRAGESASVIAARYKVSLRDFLRWNKLSKKSVLQIGDALVIQVHADAE